MWEPTPQDTSGVRLPPEVEALVEVLAEHAHEVWAAARWKEGWRYGEKPDTDGQRTPNMVPYAELPDSERQYDRDLAMETLRLLTLLGYGLVPGGQTR